MDKFLPGTFVGLLCLLAQSVLAVNSVTGTWGPQINFPLVPVAVAVVPQTGQLLAWASAKNDSVTTSDPNNKFTLFATYNPATGAVSESKIANTQHDMFCPGISVDGKGRMVVTGGSTSTAVSIFDPASNSWIAGPPMKIPRGYQASTILSNGKVFTIGGSWNGGTGGKTGEIFDPVANTWTLLPGCPPDPIYTADQQGTYRADNHAWLFGWKDASVFHAGPSKAMHWITTTGNGSIVNAGTRPGNDAMTGIFVMYDTGKILTAGGAPSYSPSQAAKTASLITLGNTGAAVTVQSIFDMTYARSFANAVVLPNGEVLVTGGQSYATVFTDTNSTQYPELWSPTHNSFTVLAAQEPSARTYHSVSILMPDATVFSGGGGLCGACGPNNHFDGRIFTPPYLYNGSALATRPTISAISTTTLGLSTKFTVSVKTVTATTPTFALIRIGTATHSVNTDQRRISLVPVSVSGTTYTLQTPSDAGITPPGYYYVFANEGNVPSLSKVVQISI